MSEPRESIPANLQRSLMIEAGYRCAVPTCRTAQPLDIEHIEDYSRVRKHDFSNMIVLCKNCHGMKGTGPRRLDRKALKQIKANLGLVNQRYNDTERRILEHFARDANATQVRLPATQVLFGYLIQDGLISAIPDTGYSVLLGTGDDDFLFQDYGLSKRGQEFVRKLREHLDI
jgi:HNH endonuclease